jgi:monovalent cation:H+ antiporter-2, CPA2 family
MLHHTPLIATIVAGLTLAFALGVIAHRLRVSPIAGYLLAGVLVGPFTPGFVADRALAAELAEIGVILLMFGVGLHFSLKDLLSVRAIAIPGALFQIGVATLLGIWLASSLGWGLASGLVFGLALSVASTVVLLRAVQERRLLDTERGRIAVGWLIVEDLAMVLTLVLLPALGMILEAERSPSSRPPLHEIVIAVGITIGKVAAFVALMLLVGRRVVPLILHYVAHTGSRELFRLAVLALALGVAFGASELFGVSFALGAFLAGMVLAESELSHQAAGEAMPLRDAFAVLFFVSVGMLFDPAILLREAWPLIATLLIILVGKSVAALLIVLAFRHPLSTALMVSASLAQIGEFSFILAGLGVHLNLLPAEGRDFILAGALISILANPLLFAALDRFQAWWERRQRGKTVEITVPSREDIPVTALADHTVLVGFGRVGSLVGEALIRVNHPLFVIEERKEVVDQLRARGVECLHGNAAAAEIIRAGNLPAAKALLVTSPNSFESGQIVHQARAANPELDIIARAHSDAEVAHLERMGSDYVVMGEREIARRMIEYIFLRRDRRNREPAEPPDAPGRALLRREDAADGARPSEEPEETGR